jgi:hypothetical protein
MLLFISSHETARLWERKSADRECRGDQRVILFHKVFRIDPRTVAVLSQSQGIQDSRSGLRMQRAERLRAGA